MQVSLKVVGGKNNGREIKIAVPEFIIGRGEDAHLKPTSDLVSRKHCAIRIENGKVIVEDLKSRNGTFVNGNKLEGTHVASIGDSVRVGRLQFEIMIDHVAAGNKKPKVQDVVEAAARTAASASSPKASIEDSIADWLVDDDDEDPKTDARRKLNNAETIQMNFEDTVAFQAATSDTDETGESLSEETEAEPEVDAKGKKKKKEYGKLPPLPKMAHGNSTTAADDVLRKFFNRR